MQIRPPEVTLICKMKKLIIYFLLLLLTANSNLFAIKPSDTLDVNRVNIPFLESLVKRKIDTIRIELGLNPLEINTELYKAAKDQAEYIVRTGEFSHSQPAGNKRGAMDRVVYYGGGEKLKMVGENLVWKHLERWCIRNSRTRTVEYR